MFTALKHQHLNILTREHVKQFCFKAITFYILFSEKKKTSELRGLFWFPQQHHAGGQI
jgi:hypothetical protein